MTGYLWFPHAPGADQVHSSLYTDPLGEGAGLSEVHSILRTQGRPPLLLTCLAQRNLPESLWTQERRSSVGHDSSGFCQRTELTRAQLSSPRSPQERAELSEVRTILREQEKPSLLLTFLAQEETDWNLLDTGTHEQTGAGSLSFLSVQRADPGYADPLGRVQEIQKCRQS